MPPSPIPVFLHDDQPFKPPYAFTGAAPSQMPEYVYGELVYDYQAWQLDPAFPPDWFTLPDRTDFEQVEGLFCPLLLPQGPPPTTWFNCPVCHATQLDP